MDDRPRTRRRRPSDRRGRPTARRRPRLWLGGASLLLAVGGTVAALAFVGDPPNRAPGGVTVAGVPVDDLGEEAVAEAVRRRADALLERPLTIAVAGVAARYEASRAGLGARAQVDRAVDAALAPRSAWERLRGRIGLGETREVPLRFTVDDAAVDRLVERVEDDLNMAPQPARVRRQGDEIEVTAGSPGFGVDPEALRASIRALPEWIEVERETLPPPIDLAAAQRAAHLGERVLDASVLVTLEGRREPLAPETLRAALRFVPRAPGIRVRLHPPTLRDALDGVVGGRERPAVDASFRVTGSEVTLVPSAEGRALDVRGLGTQIVARVREAAGPEPAVEVPARFTAIAPERTTAELEALRIEEQVSSFSTSYDCCPPRVTNIQRAAEILDGMIIPPGGRFSLNEALGQRTEERGFVAAPQISAGRLEDAVGGGVSQIATTIFNAAFFAGLRIETHTPHEFYISRYPAGREATISFGGPELVFVNDWDAGILIDAEAGSNEVRFRFFSSPLGRRVETETGEPRDYVEPTTIETTNFELAPGERVVLQSAGGAGFTVGYDRQVYRGNELLRDETYTWRYRPQNAFVEVGPPEPEAEPEADPEAPEGADPPAADPDAGDEEAPPAEGEGAPPAPGGTAATEGGAG